MIKAAFFGDNKTTLDLVYPLDRRDTIAASCNIHPKTITSQNLSLQLPALADVEVIFATSALQKITSMIFSNL